MRRERREQGAEHQIAMCCADRDRTGPAHKHIFAGIHTFKQSHLTAAFAQEWAEQSGLRAGTLGYDWIILPHC